MDGIKSELKLGELKREKLRMSLEQARAQASSILSFTLQWEELENHFDLVQQSVAKRVEEVALQKKELETAMKVLREKQEDVALKENELIEGSLKELGLKNEQLIYMQKLISKCAENLEAKDKQLRLVEEKVKKSSEELDVKKEKLDLLHSSVEECEGKLESKKKELELVTRRVDECRDEICHKDNQLDHLQRSIEEKSGELEFKERDIDLKENMIKEYDEALALKAKKLECLQNLINECSNQLDMKHNELVRSEEMIENHSKQLYEKEQTLDSFKSLIQDCTEALEAKEKKHDELDKSVKCYAAKLKSKMKKLGLLDEKIAVRSSELHSKDIEFNSLQKSIRWSKKQLDSTMEELDSVKARVRGHSKDFDLKMQEFNAIQMCMEECSQKLHLKEKQLSSVRISLQACSQQLKADEEELVSTRNSVLECTNELKSKQQKLEVLQKSLKQLSDELESKEKQLDLVEKACSEGLKEANAKEKHLGSLKTSVEEGLEKLETEKRQFEARVKEFELREEQFVSVQKAIEERSKELDLKEKQLANSRVRSDNRSSSLSQLHGTTNTVKVIPITPNQIKTERPEDFMFSNANETSFTDIWVGAAIDGRSLQGIPNEHLEEPDLRQNEVLAALQMSTNPAKFVLDLMLGTSSQCQKKGGTGFEESVLKIYVLMLEQLLQVSPVVKPDVKEDALKLAIEWKEKMKLTAENSVEIMGFLQFIAAYRLVSFFNRDEIFKFLGTAAQHEQARNVCRILGLTDMIPDFVASLTVRKQYIEAVRFVCAFDSKDKCPPELILNLFWEDINRVARDRCKMGKNSPEVVEKATDEQIAALKSVIECIKDCKLESSSPVEVIENCIVELEKQKTNRRFVVPAPSPSPIVQLKVHGQTNCNTAPSVSRSHPSSALPVQLQCQGGICASTPRTQLQGLSNKRAQTDGPVINFNTPQEETFKIPYNQSASQHGSGVLLNQVAVHFGQPTNLGDHTSQGPGN
ncbi:hypothetical protein PTKIN_Ptkin06aG0161200 [Pterospermum kingtungense]